MAGDAGRLRRADERAGTVAHRLLRPRDGDGAPAGWKATAATIPASTMSCDAPTSPICRWTQFSATRTAYFQTRDRPAGGSLRCDLRRRRPGERGVALPGRSLCPLRHRSRLQRNRIFGDIARRHCAGRQNAACRNTAAFCSASRPITSSPTWARLVLSKALWRDRRVMAHLDPLLRSSGEDGRAARARHQPAGRPAVGPGTRLGGAIWLARGPSRRQRRPESEPRRLSSSATWNPSTIAPATAASS